MTIEHAISIGSKDDYIYIRRNGWVLTLCIKLYLSNQTNSLLEARYCEHGKEKCSSIPSAAVLLYEDFVLCDKDGNKLKPKPIKEIKMEDKNYIGGEYKVVEVTYELEGPQTVNPYCFKVDVDLASSIDKNDILVVDSRSGLGLVKVLEVLDNTVENAEMVKKATAWVVDRVDQTMHNKKKQATERRAYIISQLEEKKQQLEAVAVYEMIAKSDPASAKLVEELKSLGLK